jgi:hypothetical protein
MATTTEPSRASHLTHDELDAVSRQREDCAAVVRTLGVLPQHGLEGLEYDASPRELAPPDIRITEAAAALADELHLHLD